MQYTLKQLTVFKAVAGLQSTTAAAQTLALSQSAVSSAIQQLELQIGQKLFDRVGRQLVLNRVGVSLMPAVDEFLAHAARLDFAAERRGNRRQDLLRRKLHHRKPHCG